MTRLRFLILAAGLLPAALMPAADKPNFTGTWTMDAAKSEMGGRPMPAKLVRTIGQEGDTITVATNMESDRGNISTESKYIADGKTETVNKGRFGDAKSTATWKGDSLQVESKMEMQGTQVNSSETWTLAPDAKSMIVKGTVAAGQQTFETKLVLNKQ